MGGRCSAGPRGAKSPSRHKTPSGRGLGAMGDGDGMEMTLCHSKR
jgi:hypothetical protein